MNVRPTPSASADRDEHSRSEIDRQLLEVVRNVRRRWRLRHLVRGAAATLLAALVILIGAALLLDQFRYTEAAVTAVRWLSWSLFLLLAFRFLILPQLRRVPDRRVALYIEENEPSLQTAVLSAVELRGATGPSNSPELQRRVLLDAIERCENVDLGRGIERGALRQSTGVLAGVLSAGLLTAVLSPAFLQQGALLLLMPWSGNALDNPYRVAVEPGDVEIARGSDLEIEAFLSGFESNEVTLHLREGIGDSAGGADGFGWEQMKMAPGEPLEIDGEPAPDVPYQVLVFDLQDDAEYFVEAEGLRSERFTVSVVDLPYTDRIDLRYDFPDYTGLPDQEITDGGDVAAVRGTRVFLSVQPTVEVGGARLVFEDGTRVELAVSEVSVTESADRSPGVAAFTGVFEVSERTFYSVEFDDLRGRPHRGSPEYAVRPLEDQPPVLRVLRPGRDLRVNKIEEIYAEVEASDDYGVRSLRLRFSVNGGEEESVQLVSGRARKQVSAGHTFFLEEYPLQDGDFVSYFFEAQDGRTGGRQTATSDIYFLEVRPFGQDYRRAEGGGGMQGGGGNETALSARQREIVAATFRLIRDRDDLDSKEYSESVATVALSQGRLIEQAETLIERMSNRSTLAGDEDFGKIMDHLRRALPEMAEAQKLLEEEKPNSALGAEQRAMTHLQRAEATFRDVRVSFNQNGGGGGGEENRMSEDLSDLFELELDKLSNQYEVVQRGQEQQQQQQVDEVEQRLKELARRQQKEIERKRRQGSRSQSGGGGGGSQEQLAEETEDLARRLERLAREQSNPELRQTAQRLREAVDQMRRSAASSSTSSQQGQAQRSGMSALESLEDARRLLDKNRNVQIDQEMNELQQRAQRLGQMQQRISQQVRQMGERAAESGESGTAGGAGENAAQAEAIRRLMERKEQMLGEVEGLEEQLDRMARQARGENPEVARNLQQAANSIRKNQLKEKVRYSRGVVQERESEIAEAFEREIGGNVEELLSEIDEAQQAFSGGKGDERNEDLLESARQLVQGLESLEGRLRDRLTGEPQRDGSAPGGERSAEEGVRGRQARAGEGSEEGSQSEAERREGARSAEVGQSGEQRDGTPSQNAGEQGAQAGEQPGQRPGETGQPGEGQRGGRAPGSQAEGQEEGGQSGARLRAGGDPRAGGGFGDSTRLGMNPNGSFQPGAFGTEELRQMSRELRERLRQAERLEDELREAQIEAPDLREALRQMRELDIRKITNDPQALEALRSAVVDELRRFEFQLWRDLEAQQQELVAPQEQTPLPGYEEPVSEYFKALAAREGG